MTGLLLLLMGETGALVEVRPGQLVTSGPHEVMTSISVEVTVFWRAGMAETAPAKMAAATRE